MIQPNGQVHPVAAIFPMMSDEELSDLAEDIKANGLLHPIVLDTNGVLIDGRNRLEACRRARVEPTFTTLNGHDPSGFILGNNITRRHLTAGQRAMAVAKARFATNQSSREAATLAGTSQSRIVKATAVLRYASDLADEVMDGTTGLDEAYTTALARKQEADEIAETMAELRAGAPDLAELVTEQRLGLAEATDLFHKRDRERLKQEQEDRESKERYTRGFWGAVAIFNPQSVEPDKFAKSLLDQVLLDQIPTGLEPTPSRLRQCIAVFENLIPLVEATYGNS